MLKPASLVLVLAACNADSWSLPDSQLAPPGACPVGQSKVYRDNDGDRYYPAGAASICASTTAPPPSGYARQAGDCNDANARVNPGAAEAMNGVDDDCDGQIDEQPLRLRTVSLDGQSIDDGLIVSSTGQRDMRVAVWVDTTEVLTNTSVSVDQSLAGEDHTLTLQSCTASPTVACPSPRGYIIVDDQATVVSDQPEQRLLYEVRANDGTAFRHQVTVLAGIRHPATAVAAATLSATALDRTLDALAEDLEAPIDEALRSAFAGVEGTEASYGTLDVELRAIDQAVSGEDTGEGSMEGKLSLAVSFDRINLGLSCFNVRLDNVAVVANISPRVPEYGAGYSAGGWPSRYSAPTLGAFTADWFDPSVSYGSLSGQEPTDWQADDGELAFVVHDLLLTFDGQSATSPYGGDISDSVTVWANSGACSWDWVEADAEFLLLQLLGELSYDLYQDNLVGLLRDHTASNFYVWETMVAASAAQDEDLWGTAYDAIADGLARMWEGADDPARGLPLDRLPSLTDAVEYGINETLHNGRVGQGAEDDDAPTRFAFDVPLGPTWNLHLSPDTTWFTSADQGANMSLVMQTALQGQQDADLRYSTWLLRGDALAANPSSGEPGDMATVGLGETALNQALYAVTTGGLLNMSLTAGTQLTARVPLWADVDSDGDLVVHMRGVDIETTDVGGYQHLTANGDVRVDLLQPDDAELAELQQRTGFVEGQRMFSALAHFELDSSSVNVTALRGRTVAAGSQLLVSGWLEQQLLLGVKEIACLPDSPLLAVGVADVANYCAGSEVADTYWLRAISEGSGDSLSSGHFTASLLAPGLPQLDVSAVKVLDPTLVITWNGQEVSQVSFDAEGEGASFDLNARHVSTFEFVENPSGLVWSTDEPWLRVDSAGMVTVNGDDRAFDPTGLNLGHVSASWYDVTTGATLQDSVRVVVDMSTDPTEDCFYTTHIYCP